MAGIPSLRVIKSFLSCLCIFFFGSTSHVSDGSIIQDATKACAVRWNIEQYHREVKQLTGIGKCQASNGKA